MKYQLLVSFAGLLLVVALSLFPPTANADFVWRKTVTGTIFCTLCILGVLAVFSPSQCRGIVKVKQKPANMETDIDDTSPALEGHHPNCGKYTAHVFRINGKTFCAACIGLLVGGVLALVVGVFYFFGGWTVASYGSLLVMLGVVGVVVGLFQFKFGNITRFLANIVFVLGALFVLIGVDVLVESLVFDLFTVSLIVFWLLTRISLSTYDHQVICSRCETGGCRFKK
ncbi:MAG: hypothetical protein WC325_02805 [Candidatus Bathyarchaeia archaeon]